MSVQTAFGFFDEVRVIKAWVRPAVMAFKPFNKGGWESTRNERVKLEDWLMWHAPLSANWEGCEA